MDIPFWKMHGAANDFILVDDRAETFPAENRDWIESIADRRTGIGSDGLILIQPAENADFRMRFFNPDGGEAEMCGNGARCVARLARDIGVAKDTMVFDTVAGPVHAEIQGEVVTIELTKPKDWELEFSLNLNGDSFTASFVNTGVPHAVVILEDTEAADIKKLGRGIRHHDRFQPAGTNANLITVTGRDALRVRTYERGVEDETWACGTGIAASGLVAHKLGLVTKPVQITATSGDVLRVDYEPDGEGADKVTLTGPAVHVFQGTLAYSE